MPANSCCMRGRFLTRGLAPVLVLALLAGPIAHAIPRELSDRGSLPALASASGNFTRLAHADWTTGRGRTRVRWQLDARDFVYVHGWGVPGTSSGAQVTLSKLVCVPKGCRGNAQGWSLDEGEFEFDPLLTEVRVAVPGEIDLVWKATGDYEPLVIRHAKHRVYDDPSDYVGADVEAGAVVALGRRARLTGQIRGHPGRLSVSNAEIFLWTGWWSYGAACVVDEGSPCL
jgi:hypothetical protein